MRNRTYLVFGLLLALVIGAGTQSNNHGVLPTVPNAHAQVQIVLNGFITGWNASTNKNPTITVANGEQVTLILKSADLATHQFLLDGDNDGVSDTADCPTTDPCSAVFSTANGIIYRFTVNLAQGTYTYYCAIHPTTMFGSFVVSGSVGALSLPVDKLALVAPYLVFAALVVALVSTVVIGRRSGRAKRSVKA